MSRFLRAAFLLSLRLATLGCLIVTLFGFAGSWHWYFDLFNHLRPQYFLASLTLVILLTLARSKKWAVAAAIALGLNVIVLAPHVSPLPKSADTSSPAAVPLRVMTFNLLARNKQYDLVEAYLRREKPDIIGLQEVSVHWVPILAKLKDIYPHQHLETRSRGNFGLGILSRIPMTQPALVWSQQQQPRELTGLAAEFIVNNKTVSILDIHALHPTSERGVSRVRTLHDRITAWSNEKQKAGHAVIVLGDFNCTPWSVLFREFTRESALTDTSQGRVFQATRHVFLPDQIMIDHLFISSHLQTTHREVGPNVGSDHRPVFVDLQFTP